VVIVVLLTEEEFRKFKKSDPEMVEKVYHACKKNIFNYLLIKTRGNNELAKELLHNTFCSVIESAPKVKNMENIPAWLLRIAHRRMIDFRRKRLREKKYFDKVKQQEKSRQEYIAMHMDDKSDKKRRVLLLHMAIDALNPDYRKIVRLKYFEEKKVDEIASLIGRSSKSVESMLFRARNNLKNHMLVLAKRYHL
jgi:RNA polymerase sigma-70 factor (ECF subfamily)